MARINVFIHLVRKFFLQKALVEQFLKKKLKTKVKRITDYASVDPIENLLLKPKERTGDELGVDKEDNEKLEDHQEESMENGKTNGKEEEELQTQETNGPTQSTEENSEETKLQEDDSSKPKGAPQYNPQRQSFCVIYHIKKLSKQAVHQQVSGPIVPVEVNSNV